WGTLPAASRVTLRLAGVPANDVLRLARGSFTSDGLAQVGPETLECAVRGVTRVPLPAGHGVIAALLTIELPQSVRYGQRFRVLVHHAGNPRRIVGSIAIDIPVLKADALLPEAQDAYAVMSWNALHVPAGHPQSSILGDYRRVL